MSALQVLQTFDENTLPDLDVVVEGALEFFEETPVPNITDTSISHPLVLGSGNAEITGRVLFQNHDAVYADESTYTAQYKKARARINDVVIISASGKKHAVEIAAWAEAEGLRPWLLTNNPAAPAAEHIPRDQMLVFPRNREPYTYNTSTYMGMMLGHTKENPHEILEYIHTHVSPALADNRLAEYDAFYLMIPPQFLPIRDMFMTKFDELFGPKISGRVFTFEQTKHAKTVVPDDRECFVSLGEPNDTFGNPANRIHIPLPENASFVAMLAIGYYTIGHIQKANPPYFKENIAAYTEQASELFGQIISPVTG